VLLRQCHSQISRELNDTTSPTVLQWKPQGSRLERVNSLYQWAYVLLPNLNIIIMNLGLIQRCDQVSKCPFFNHFFNHFRNILTITLRKIVNT
jgi:hypothetical protein